MFRRLWSIVRKEFIQIVRDPRTLALALPSSLTDLPAALDKPVSDQVNVWVCRGVTCLAPVSNWPDLERTLLGPV